MLWPLIRYSYNTHNLDLPTPAPSPPTWMLTEAQCKSVVEKKGAQRLPAIWNTTGSAPTIRAATSSARLIYGFRISVLFGLDPDDRRRP